MIVVNVPICIKYVKHQTKKNTCSKILTSKLWFKIIWAIWLAENVTLVKTWIWVLVCSRTPTQLSPSPIPSPDCPLCPVSVVAPCQSYWHHGMPAAWNLSVYHSYHTQALTAGRERNRKGQYQILVSGIIIMLILCLITDAMINAEYQPPHNTVNSLIYNGINVCVFETKTMFTGINICS